VEIKNMKKSFSNKSLMTSFVISFLLICNSNILGQSNKSNETFVVPAGGNTWLVDNISDTIKVITDNGITNWAKIENKFRIYFKLTKVGKLQLSLNAKVYSGESKIKCSINGQSYEVKINNTDFKDIFICNIDIIQPGYQYIEIEGIEKSDNVFAEINSVLLSGDVTEGKVYFVHDDFYWGRRGPSVHLSYQIPEEVREVKWFYNEIKVPEGEDVIGSYFMANGFAFGYFGIQVNSETERRVLFSVWSPYETQNPDEIPEEYKIELMDKSDGVYSGEFGSEGSGGQSYLKYNWKAGSVYKFLLKGEPTNNNHTIFTAYFFAPEVGEWKLIASFNRPFTDSYLTKLYSFLENFHTETGNISRKAFYTNQWDCDSQNNWYELTKAKFTADATARKDARMDYTGGIEYGEFFLKNCGFFDETTKIDSWYSKNPQNNKPNIDFSRLK